MGFSLTGTHVIFFIAAVIAASAVSGVLLAVTNDLSKSLSDKGDRVQKHLDTEFKIINDPNHIPSSANNYLFYLKNIGSGELETTNETFHLFVDGEIVVKENYYFSDGAIKPDEVTTIYIDTSEISSGDHTLRVVGPQDIEDTFTFTI